MISPQIDLCIDARMAYSSGIGTCIRNIVPFLASPPFHPILLVSEYLPFPNIDQILFNSPIYSLKEQLLFPLKIPKCDLFWSPHYNIPLLPIRAKKRVVTIHDVCHLAQDHWNFLQQMYAKRVMKQAINQSDLVLTGSQFTKDELIHHAGFANQVIPFAVDQAFFKRNMNMSLLTKYSIQEPFALFVGSEKPHKNLQRLIQAIQTIPDLKLVVIGSVNQTYISNRVQILGFVPDEDLPGLYSLARVFIFPSLYEGFGLPPLEAMSCGCPTVVSRAASIPEVCGEASAYFDPYDISDISKVIEKVWTDQNLRDRLISKGIEKTATMRWQNTGEQYRKAFESLSKH